MFSTYSPAFVFDADGRLEQPQPHPHPHSHPYLRGPKAETTTTTTTTKAIKPKGNKESRSRLVANLNLALAGLNPTHTTTTTTTTTRFTTTTTVGTPYSIVSPPTSPRKKGYGHSYSPSTPTMPNPYNLDKKESSTPTQYKPPSRHSSLRGFQRNPSTRLIPASSSSSSSSRESLSLPAHPAIHLRQSGISTYPSRPSLDSVASSSSGSSSGTNADTGHTRPTSTGTRKIPIIVPPPLRLEHSNLHQNQYHHTHAPVIDISSSSSAIPTRTPPPQVDSKTALTPSPSLAPPPPALPSPGSPHLPSEEERRRKRLAKVVRTLGEEVPAELVFKGGAKPLLNVTVFPEPPPSPRAGVGVGVDGDKGGWGGGGGASLTRKEQKMVAPRGGGGGVGVGVGNLNLRRKASFSLTAFPHFSVVLPNHGLGRGHGRGKSRDLDLEVEMSRDITPTPTPTNIGPFNSMGFTSTRTRTRVRPDSGLLSPIIFRRPISQLIPTDIESEFDSYPPHSNSPPLRSPPLHPHSPPYQSKTRQKEDKNAISESREERLARRASLHTSVVLPPLNEFEVESGVGGDSAWRYSRSVPGHGDDDEGDEEEEEEEEEGGGEGARTPTPTPTPTRTANGSGSGTNLPFAEYDYDSPVPTPTPTLAQLRGRPETPFADAGVPLVGEVIGVGAGSRREKRQGWSGEWNRGDMQDVIQRLRTLK